MKKQPFLILVSIFIAGILFQSYIEFGIKFWVFCLSCSFLLSGLVFWKNYYYQKFRNLFLVFLFCSLGGFFHSLNISENQYNNLEDGKYKVTFQLNKKLNPTKKYYRYEVKILKIALSKRLSAFDIVLFIPKENKELNFLELYQTDLYLNNVKAPNNNFQFNYAEYLARRKIYYQAFANTEILSYHKTSLSFVDRVRQWRLDILKSIDKSELNKESKVFLKGIILADRTAMSAESVSDFTETGLVHFLAISGSHMAIIFMMIVFVLQKILRISRKNWCVVLALLFIWIFGFFIDFGSSVLRSCIMITCYYAFLLLDRKPDFLHTMSLSAFIILLLDTQSIFDIGFQLSFSAVLGIYLFNASFLKLFSKPKNQFQNLFLNVICISLSAQISTLPLVLYYFHQYSLVSVIANILIVPFSEFIIILSFILLALCSFGLNIGIVIFIYDFIVSLLLKLIHFFAEADFLFSDKIPMSLLECSISVVSLYFFSQFLSKKTIRSVYRFSFFLLIFLLIRLILNFYNFEKKEVLVVDYFKDEVLIVKNKGLAKFYIHSTIDKDKIVKSIVLPYLNYRRIDTYTLNEFPINIDKIIVDGKVYSIANRK